MISEILNDIKNVFESELKIHLKRDFKNFKYCTVMEFHKETNIYIMSDFIAAYVYFNNINWILVDQNSFNCLKESKKKCVLMHECMHLISTKVNPNKYSVGFTMMNRYLVPLNEGLNEIAASYVYKKIYKKQYDYSKGYYINRVLAGYIIDVVYPNQLEFVKDYVTKDPYQFYEKIFYYFKVNNLVELNNIIKEIQTKYRTIKDPTLSRCIVESVLKVR